jgi:hypothetical protein
MPTIGLDSNHAKENAYGIRQPRCGRLRQPVPAARLRLQPPTLALATTARGNTPRQFP